MSLSSLMRVCASPKILRLAMASVVLSISALAQDTVTLKDGKTEQGRVKSTDYEGVALEAKGQAKTIDWSNVSGITYKDSPEKYTSGRDEFENGRYDEAIATLNDVKNDSKVRGPIRQEALYTIAMANLAKGDWDGAIAAFDALRKDFPKSRYLMEAGEGYVMAFTAKKDYPGALKALDTMSTEATMQGVPQSFSGTISMLKGRLLEQQNKISEAAAAYGVAEKTTGVALVVQQQARLGQARCLVQQKKASDAEAIFRKLTSEDAGNLVLAGAWNGLGDIWVQEAKDKGDAEKVEKLYDALFAYMRGVAQYGPLPGESRSEYKHALEGTINTFRGLSQTEKNADRKANYKRNYEARQEQLNREFPPAK